MRAGRVLSREHGAQGRLAGPGALSLSPCYGTSGRTVGPGGRLDCAHTGLFRSAGHALSMKRAHWIFSTAQSRHYVHWLRFCDRTVNDPAISTLSAQKSISCMQQSCVLKFGLFVASKLSATNVAWYSVGNSPAFESSPPRAVWEIDHSGQSRLGKLNSVYGRRNLDRWIIPRR